jgi:hypothetical protein
MKFDKSYDIIVAGLGTAGAIALITAAKRGLRVLGIDTLNAMGGTGTLGAIRSYYFGSEGGAYEQINAEAAKLQAAVYTETSALHFDAKAYVLEDTASNYGADILYEARITEVYTEGTKVNGVSVFSNGEFLSIKFEVIIDCTGEAEICYLAGCPVKIGRSCDGQAQPFSNVPITGKNGDVNCINKDSGYVRQNDCYDLSNKIISSLSFLNTIKNNTGSDVKFYTTASLLGIREGRTIIGEENITLADFFDNNFSEKILFYAYSNADNHGKDTAFEDEPLTDWYVAAGLWGVNFSVGVPVGALIPKGYSGILVAGRCLAVDHNIAPCIRMKSDMEKCGEAAAEMAYLSIKDRTALKDIDYNKLVAMLSESGCLNPANNVGFVNRTAPEKLIPFEWLTDINDIIKELKSEKPGIAIWSAKRLGSGIREELENCLATDDYLLKKNAAIALGILGLPAACETLRNMVNTRDGFIPSTSLKYSYTHATTAIYLLGKLRDYDSVEVLLDVIRSEGAFETANFTTDELHSTEADIRFQDISYALVALKRISEKHAGLTPYIKEVIRQKILNKDFSLFISLKSNPYIKHDMAYKLRAFVQDQFDKPSQL